MSHLYTTLTSNLHILGVIKLLQSNNPLLYLLTFQQFADSTRYVYLIRVNGSAAVPWAHLFPSLQPSKLMLCLSSDNLQTWTWLLASKVVARQKNRSKPISQTANHEVSSEAHQTYTSHRDIKQTTRKASSYCSTHRLSYSSLYEQTGAPPERGRETHRRAAERYVQ